MKFDFRESRIISNGNIIKYKYRPMWRPCATARRDDRAAVGWAWTGRNLILDEALHMGIYFEIKKSLRKSTMQETCLLETARRLSKNSARMSALKLSKEKSVGRL